MTIRRIIVAAFAATMFVTPAAAAIPDPIGYPSTPSQPLTTQNTEEPVERPCFMVRPNWNESLDGPQPTCSESQHAH